MMQPQDGKENVHYSAIEFSVSSERYSILASTCVVSKMVISG